jgi:hypothetical protein
MPTIYIPSLFKQRKRKYGKRLARARRELTVFLDSFEAEAGADAAGVLRAYAALSWSPRQAGDGLQVGPPTVFDDVRRLKRKVTGLSRRLHSPSCFYRERKEPPYVLWHYGITWDDLGRLAEDGVLPLEHVLRLLDVLVNRKPDREVVGRGRAFRRRLIRFLRRAVELEEEVRCGIV